MKTHALLRLIAAVFCVLPLSASPITRTWDDGGADANFSTAANWNPDGVPANGDDLVFPAAAPATVTNDLSSLTFGSLSFPAGVTLAGSPFTLTGGITLSNSGAGFRSAVTIAANVTLGANQTFNCAGGGSLTFNGSVSFGARTLTVTGARPCTFNGATGSSTAGSKLIKTGTGLLRVTANASTNLPWDVSDGILDVDGTLQATVNLTGGKLTGDGTLTSLTASGGDIEPDAAGLAVSGNTTLGGTSRGVFHLTGPGAENTLSCGGTVTIQGSATMTVDAVGYTPVWDEDFQLLTKSPASLITGTFSNAADNAEVPLGSGLISRAHYNGGNGNDLTLDVFSTTRTWDGGNTLNDNWDEAENWSSNIRPNFGDVLVFPAGIQSSDRGMDNNFPNDTIFRQLVFNGDDFTVRGNRFKLSHGIQVPAEVNCVHMDASIALAADQTFVLGGVLELGLLDEINTAGHVLSLFSQGSAVNIGRAGVDGDITGSGSVVVAAGDIVLLDKTTYTGPTTIRPGAKLSLSFYELSVGEPSLGTVAAPTRVEGGLSMANNRTTGVFRLEEELTLIPGSILSMDASGGLGGLADGTNEITGNIILEAGSSDPIHISVGAGKNELTNRIQGQGNLRIEAQQGLVNDSFSLRGPVANTFTGSLTLLRDTMRLEKSAPGVLAVSCDELNIDPPNPGTTATVETREDEQIADTCHVTVQGGGFLNIGNITSRTETIDTLTLEGGTAAGPGNSLLILKRINSPGTTAASLTLDTRFTATDSVVDVAVSGGLLKVEADLSRTGSALLRKTGAGTLELASGQMSLPMQIDGGSILLRTAVPQLISLNGGTVTGNSAASGGITSMSGGGNVVPLGTAGQTAVLPCGPVIFNAATTLQMQIATATAGTGYDQLSVTGSVGLGGAALSLQLLTGFNVPLGQSIVLVANDGTDAINGTFAGLPPGAFISIPANNGGGGWTISYNGGTGNDVALTRVAAPPVDPTPVLTAVTLGNPDQNGNRSVTVTGKGAPGVSYRVEISVNFQQWTIGSTQTAAAGTGALSFSLTASPPVRAKEFYRIRKL